VVCISALSLWPYGFFTHAPEGCLTATISGRAERSEGESAACGGWAPLNQRLRHFLDLAHRSPVAICHRLTEQSLSLGSQLGSADPFGGIQIKHLVDKLKSFAVTLEAIKRF